MSGYPKARWHVLAQPRITPTGAAGPLEVLALRISRLRAHSRTNLNVVTTFLRLRRIFFNHLLLVSQLLMHGRKISRADKERIVLRVGWHMGNVYEWSHHTALALREGVSQDEIDSFAKADSPLWSERTRSFIACVDELVATNTLSPQSWNRLRGQLCESAAMEFCMLVGHYVMVAMAINSLGVQVEEQFQLGPLPQPAAAQR